MGIITLPLAQSGNWVLKMLLRKLNPMRLCLKPIKSHKLQVLEQSKPMTLGIKTFKLDK